MPFVPRELSKSDYFSNIVNFPFILTGTDSLLPNRFFCFFVVISSRIPVRFIDKCAIAATIALSIRKTDKMTLTGARVIISHMVYQIIPIPIATIETPDITEIFIFSDFVNSRTTFGSGTFGYEWFSSWCRFNPYWKIMENSSRNFSEILILRVVTQAILLENSSNFFFEISILGRHTDRLTGKLIHSNCLTETIYDM